MRALVAAAAAALALAGCSGGGDGLDARSYEVRVVGVPATASPGGAFTATVEVTGDQTDTTEHIGAHYWPGTMPNPTEHLPSGVDCGHTEGPIRIPGGPFPSPCTAPATRGTYTVRAHVRIVDGATVWDWWSPEGTTFTVP